MLTEPKHPVGPTDGAVVGVLRALLIVIPNFLCQFLLWEREHSEEQINVSFNASPSKLNIVCILIFSGNNDITKCIIIV